MLAGTATTGAAGIHLSMRRHRPRHQETYQFPRGYNTIEISIAIVFARLARKSGVAHDCAATARLNGGKKGIDYKDYF